MPFLLVSMVLGVTDYIVFNFFSHNTHLLTNLLLLVFVVSVLSCEF